MKIIYTIPGLGTTEELFKNISVSNHEIRVLTWPVPEKNLSLKDYALKFLPQIDQSKSITLLGVSFGGMLCAQLAESVPTGKVFLISSCSNRTEFPLLLRLLKAVPAYKLFSDRLIRTVAKTKRAFIGFEKSFDPVFRKMIDKMPESYFSYCIDYIINWGLKTNSLSVIHIHGTSDKLLPLKKTKGSYIIKGGSHAMVLNKSMEINKILNQELNGSQTSA